METWNAMDEGRRSRLSLWLLTASLVVALGTPAWSAGAPGARECADEAAMPPIEQVILPVPQAGKWRGKGFGDKRKLDVEIEACGQKILGLIGVRLKLVGDQMLALERDEDGRYKARFTYSEGGPPVIVTWDVEAESESRITGRMTIMGRGDNVEFDLIKPKPGSEMTDCECEAVKNRRERVDRILTERRANARTAVEYDNATGWSTDPETCALREDGLDRNFPTRASLEVAARAGWEGELVHRDRCCAVHGAGSTGSAYSEWLRNSTEQHQADEIEALTTQLDVLDTWLADRCPQR